MKTKLTEWLVKPLINEVELPVKVGDEVLMGRFKNKRVKVKSIDYNEKGDLLINGRPALKFRLVKNDKKLLPNKTTNKKSTEPDSDRKGVDDEYPHYKLKEDDKEPKFHSVHRTSSFEATFGRWYANYVPLSTKKIQSILGKEKVSVFHVGNAEYESDIKQVQRIVGKKGTLSTFTSVDKGEKLAKGKGIQSGGGIIYQIEGTLLVASTRDMQSMPDNTGRRWIAIQDLAGKVAGSKMYKELKKSIESKKMDRRSWDKIEREEEQKWMKKVDYYGDDYTGGYDRKEKELKKIMGPIKRKWIKDYIDMGYKIIDKYKAQIKRNILSQKDKPSEHGWNEILVNQIKIKDVFLLSRNDYPNIKKAAEKIATGTVTVGTPGKFRKWYNERGGIINEAKRIPRKKGQHRGSSSHSDLYTDENPKGTIKGLKFATVDDAKKSVSKIRNSGKKHAHKIQAAVAMEQRAREMGKTAQAAVYRAYINQMKKKTKKKNEQGLGSDKKVIGSDDYTFGPDWIPTNLAQRKKMKRIHQKTNRSIRKNESKLFSPDWWTQKLDLEEAFAVKGNKVEKFITGKNLTHKGRKYKEIEFETIKVDNPKKMVTLRILAPKNLFGQKVPVRFQTLRRGPFLKTDTKKKVKEQIDKSSETKELLLMGGAAGHMSHPFDDNRLTFGDFKNIINMSLEGKLSREDNVTEKLDGQNLMISYVDGELKGARNKGHLKNRGKTSLNIAGMKSVFSGRGDIEKAFVGAMKDLQNAVGKLSDKQKEKTFGNGSKWMNLEIVYPATANIIDYDVSELFFHGSVEVNEDGTVKSQVTDSARMLEGMIRQANANIQKRFKVSKPVVLNLPKVQDFSKKKKYFLSKLRKLQAIYKLKDNNTLGMHNEMYWREYIFNGAKQHKYKIPKNVLESLVKRWAYLNKSFRLDKKSIKNEKFLSWAKGVDKFDHKKLSYDNIKPFELLFLELGAEILKNLEGFLAVNPKKAVQKIKKDLKSAISGLKTSKDIKKIDLLKKNLNKINSIGGTSAIVPSEGLVFKYKGNMYKFTGAFAPVNQIVGALKF